MIRRIIKLGVLLTLAWCLVDAVCDTVKYNVGMARLEAQYRGESVVKRDWKIKGADLKMKQRRDVDIVIPGVDTTLVVQDTTFLKITQYTVNVRPAK